MMINYLLGGLCGYRPRGKISSTFIYNPIYEAYSPMAGVNYYPSHWLSIQVAFGESPDGVSGQQFTNSS